VKLTLLCAFGAGYVLGTKAGRERYEQLRGLARDASQRLETTGVRQHLEDYGSRLDMYSSSRGRRSETVR
jgi:hypothetical protein